jgi:uncharacterized protein YjiK
VEVLQALVWTLACAAAVEGPVAKPQAPPLLLEGRWVFDPEGKAVRPREFERGLQTSALMARGDLLWTMGDQRSEWPGALLAIDPGTARLRWGPIKPRLEEPAGGNPLYAEYRSIRNSDFEGLAADPKDASTFYGITEDKRQWVVKLRLEEKSTPPEAVIGEITALEFPPDLKPYRDDPNYRVEGIAISDDGRTMYLAWERAADNLPRIYSVPAGEACSGKTARPREVPIPFAAVGPRADKPNALLNLNDLQFLRHGGRPLLLALARDQERILVIDLEEAKVKSTIDLDLRAPGGEAVRWVSPEGIAADPARDRLWIINDPDSIRGNYRRAADPAAQGNFAAMAPLLFETKLSAVLK